MKFVDLRADLITPHVAATLVPAFVAGYDMAAEAAETFDFLSGSLRPLALPHLRNWAVEHELYRRAKAGLIPFTGRFVSNSRNNHVHLELEYSGFILTVSQTHRMTDLPRECVFRNDHNLDGQLFLSDLNLEEERPTNTYAILTHGHNSMTPKHILCGIPSSDMKSWVQQVNLHEIAGEFSIVDPAPIDEEIKLDYRNSIKKRLAHT